MSNIHKYIIKTADSLFNMVLVIILCIVGLYCAYSLWDNQQIYAAAENVQEDMLKLKPELLEDGGASFEELLAINPDVCAWVTLDNTEVDYPILQGKDNLDYINTDVYGNFALAGSIFLDSRCDREFRSAYSLVYGHYMANRRMFGDLELYKDKKFFEENTTGTLLLPDRSYDLKIFACMLVDSRDEVIFEPQKWETNAATVLNYAEQNALHINKDLIKKLKQTNNLQILSLSTCSYEYDDARTIVLAVMEPHNTD